MSLILDEEYPEALALIAHASYEYLTKRQKLDHPAAAQASLELAEAVRNNLGGGHIYIPKGQEWELSIRDREIWDKFKGDNYSALSREYNLTEMRIRQIVERCRKAHIKQRQSDLF